MRVRVILVHQFLDMLVRVRGGGVQRVSVFVVSDPAVEPVDLVATLARGVVCVALGFLRVLLGIP